MTIIYESNIEQFVIELLQAQGFTYLSPEAQEEERQNLGDVILKERLQNAIDTLNPTIPQEAKEQAFKQVLNLPSQNLMDNNEAFHRLLTEGIEVEYMGEEGIKGDKLRLIDYEDALNNEFVVCEASPFLVEIFGMTITPPSPARFPSPAYFSWHPAVP